MYNNQTVFPYYWRPGPSYKDSNGKIIYYSSRPLVVFTSSIPTSEGFISLIPTLETFRAFNWKDFLSTKLINNCNIKVLVKYKELKVVKHSSLLGRVIIGFKEYFLLIIKTLIIYRMGEDQ